MYTPKFIPLPSPKSNSISGYAPAGGPASVSPGAAIKRAPALP